MLSNRLLLYFLSALFCTGVSAAPPLQRSPELFTVSQTERSEATKNQAEQLAGKPDQSKEELLTNDSIVELLKVGLDEDIIIDKIQKSTCHFDMSVQGLVGLKKAGATDRLIHFMMDPSKPAEQKTMLQVRTTGSLPPPAIPALPPSPTVSNLPTEIGVYIKRDEQWIEIQPEIVNWKTGGVLKNIASAGVVKGDVNGLINGAHSRNAIQTPLGFLIVTPEGVALTEYQLIRLREKKDTREFRTVTGGVFHASTGATRDLLQFEGTKVASRSFSVNLPTLGAGEYGFLPPGAMAGSGGAGAARLGKMYTFRVGE